MGNNEMFSLYTESQKQDLLEYLKTYKLEFRDTLDISEKIKFGIEIEAECEGLKKILSDSDYRQLQLNNEILQYYKDYFKQIGKSTYDFETCPWIIKSDITVKEGAEIHSPILTDTKQSWEELKKICEFLQKLDAISTDNTATHIHFDGESYLRNVYDLYNLIKLYSVYENVLYLFGTGEFMNFRERIFRYAKPAAKNFHRKFGSFYFHNFDYQSVSRKVVFSYYSGFRLTNLDPKNNTKETLEFRFANGTLSPTIIQNLINAEAKFCSYAISDNYDDDFITRKFNHLKLPATNREILNQYLNTPLDDILELADLIFDNTIDKLYFIRQCIKKTETHPKEGLQKAKKFY